MGPDYDPTFEARSPAMSFKSSVSADLTFTQNASFVNATCSFNISSLMCHSQKTTLETPNGQPGQVKDKGERQ